MYVFIIELAIEKLCFFCKLLQVRSTKGHKSKVRLAFVLFCDFYGSEKLVYSFIIRAFGVFIPYTHYTTTPLISTKQKHNHLIINVLQFIAILKDIKIVNQNQNFCPFVNASSLVSL